MVVDFITEVLPKSVLISGKDYPVRWDFRPWMEFESVRYRSKTDEEIIIRMLQKCYPQIPADINEAVDKMLWFYRCGETAEKEEKIQRYQRRTSKEPAFSFSQDSPYIYSAFREQYGIDLTEVQELHWWKFMALFESLGEDTKMSKIMYYRKASTTGMSKNQRAFVNDMKRLYRIKREPGKKMSLHERNQEWRDYVQQRHGGQGMLS